MRVMGESDRSPGTALLPWDRQAQSQGAPQRPYVKGLVPRRGSTGRVEPLGGGDMLGPAVLFLTAASWPELTVLLYCELLITAVLHPPGEPKPPDLGLKVTF